jgi:hypothetical protein
MAGLNHKPGSILILGSCLQALILRSFTLLAKPGPKRQNTLQTFWQQGGCGACSRVVQAKLNHVVER